LLYRNIREKGWEKENVKKMKMKKKIPPGNKYPGFENLMLVFFELGKKRNVKSKTVLQYIYT